MKTLTKKIIGFRVERYGHFIDLAGGGKIGVDFSGNILLDEGDGKDRFHGAAITASPLSSFVISENRLTLHFGSTMTHDLGLIPNLDTAKTWVSEVNRKMTGARP